MSTCHHSNEVEVAVAVEEVEVVEALEEADEDEIQDHTMVEALGETDEVGAEAVDHSDTTMALETAMEATHQAVINSVERDKLLQMRQPRLTQLEISSRRLMNK